MSWTGTKCLLSQRQSSCVLGAWQQFQINWCFESTMIRFLFLDLYESANLCSKWRVAYQVNLDRDRFVSRALGFLAARTSVCWMQIFASFSSLTLVLQLMLVFLSLVNLWQNFCRRTHAFACCCTLASRCSHRCAQSNRQALCRERCRACRSSGAPAPRSPDLRWTTWPMTSSERRKATRRWPLVSWWTRPIPLSTQSLVSR